MRASTVVALLIVGSIALAGCVEESPQAKGKNARKAGQTSAPPPGPILGNNLTPAVFSAPKIIDGGRAGGEPVITVTPKGTILVAAHPGYTHWHPSPDAVPPTSSELVVPSQGQSYLWRSADKGTTWKVVSLLPVDNPPNAGPRGVGQGVSDPDFAVDSNGRIYLTDLEALAEASVSWSDDDGVSWLEGNNAAAGGIVDRQWLATHNTTLYFRGNGANDVRKSEDGGTTFTNTGDARCAGDIVVNPLNGHIYVGCSGGVAVSTDGGRVFATKSSGVAGAGPIVAEPAVDSAGTIYRGVDPRRSDIVLTWTKDEGATWSSLPLGRFFPEVAAGTLIWPWTSAGSEDRVSVSFFASPAKSAASQGGDWFVYNAIVLNATTDHPTVYATKVTPTPFHRGPMCQGGTGCQATTAVDDGSDRRLGDFFESTIDHEGVVHIVWSDTQAKPTDTISHVGYSRLMDGPRLVEGPVPKGFPTQG